MPTPAPGRPAVFRKPRLLVVGCGDVGERVLRQLGGRWRVAVLTTSPARREALRALGARPLLGDLDRPATLGRLGALAPRVLHLAPPPAQGDDDPRTAALLRVLARGGAGERLVYGSTTGVYGDAGGARFDETRALAPATARARRRVAAEARLRHHGRAAGCCVTLLRIPGIYALDRAGGDPRERVARGTPVLHAEEDVYTNHIHADDLARACVAALLRGRPQRAVHVCDDSELKMGDYYALVAALAGLPPPPRIARADAAARLGAATLSFMSESRRLSNRRLKAELRVALRYPDVRAGLAPGR
ncbi:MAG TPA: NAD-dependent epimerase/dehydratase family protein [Methylibium sp.]|nr:NAD-dependent epimerase/dehydratase family protein [Methylibium sp.]